MIPNVLDIELCQCGGPSFLEFWDRHMWVVSGLFFFALMVVAFAASEIASGLGDRRVR